jgi:flagellum-specific peptidoglycan hydrolase FlgJ
VRTRSWDANWRDWWNERPFLFLNLLHGSNLLDRKRAPTLMTPKQKEFVLTAAIAAKTAGHVFPEIAACEAALESSYGNSLLALQDLNLFGMKQHRHPVFGTANLPTREFEHGKWFATTAAWVVYPNLGACFADRMATLERLAPEYPNYASALDAKDAASYVTVVSKSWSTDPDRAKKVIAIYQEAFS